MSDKFRRVLVSQDDKEIYITFAQYDDKWLNYINGTTDSLSLMCMYRFGPFYIDKWEDLRDAAIIILAITLWKRGHLCYQEGQ